MWGGWIKFHSTLGAHGTTDCLNPPDSLVNRIPLNQDWCAANACRRVLPRPPAWLHSLSGSYFNESMANSYPAHLLYRIIEPSMAASSPSRLQSCITEWLPGYLVSPFQWMRCSCHSLSETRVPCAKCTRQLNQLTEQTNWTNQPANQPTGCLATRLLAALFLPLPETWVIIPCGKCTRQPSQPTN